MRFQAQHIEELEAGAIVEINGTVYVRMADSHHEHIVGYLFDPKTGWWGHWSRLILGNEMVIGRQSL